MKLEEEWKELIQKNEFIYIYGAGKIGKRIWNLIQREHAEVKGFLVSDLAGNPVQLNDVPVYTPEQIEQKDSLILISVTDLYQEGILAHLKELGFINLVVAYKFSFMAVEAPQEMPETIMIDTRELFWCQYRENAFNRYDTIVRILAIENYYKKNDFGMDLYEKMQNLRHSTESYGKIAVDRFAKLIESFAGGYWESSELVVDEKLQLFDGSHRLALALYHALPQVKIRILGKTENILYGREWFNERFTD